MKTVALVTPTLTEKQSQVFTECAKYFNGLTFKEAEEILFELMSFIKASSLVQQQGL